MPDEPSTLRGHLGPPRSEPDGAPMGLDDAVADAATPARVVSLRDAQRERLDAEAQRLTRLESQLANLQLILRTDQARLAIDRLRFAVHGLCGTMPSAERQEPAQRPRLVRVK